MQITAGSLLGTFGPQSQSVAERLATDGLVHFVSTDAHGLKSRRPQLGGRPPADGRVGRAGAGRPVLPPQSGGGGRRASRSLPAAAPSNRPAAAGSDGRRPADECRSSRSGGDGVRPAEHAGRGALGRSLAGLAAGALLADTRRWHRAAGAADWADERVSGPFVCRADFRLDEYDGLFVELAQLQIDLSHALGVEPAREPVELYLFQTEQAYRTFLQVRLPQVPYRRALFVKGRGPGKVFAYKSKALPVDVRHEGTHGLLHAALPMVPLWLDEGLAEYFEVPAGQAEPMAIPI